MGTRGVDNGFFCNPGASPSGTIWLHISPVMGPRESSVFGVETEVKAFRHHYSMNCSSVDCVARKDREALNFSLMLTNSAMDLN